MTLIMHVTLLQYEDCVGSNPKEIFVNSPSRGHTFVIIKWQTSIS